jgi:hypothetical protein
VKRLALASSLLCLILAILYLFLSPQESENLKKARKSYALKDWRAAFNDSARELRDNPNDTSAKRLMARSAARIQRDNVAMDLYNSLQGAESPEDFFLVGTILFRQGRIQDGEKMFRRSLEIDPNYHESAKFLAQFLFQNRRYEDALQNAEKWELFQPDQNEAELFQARILEAINQPAKASALLNSILQRGQQQSDLSSQSPESLELMLARNLLRSARPNEAIEILNKMKNADSDADLLWLKSRANLQLGKLSESLGFYHQSKALANAAAQNQMEEPSPYAGALSCRECHSEIYEDQQNSRHALTFRPADHHSDLTWSNFQKTDPGIKEARAEFQKSNSPLQFQFSNQSHELKPIVKYILGSGRHAVTPLLQLPDEKSLYECRWTYYSSVNDWDLTPGQPPMPPGLTELIGTPQSADMLRLCLNCHTTNPSAILDSNGPEAMDKAIGCEKCHGPGANHINAMKLKFPDKAIGRFRRNSSGTRPQVMQMCAECHGTMGRELAASFDAGTVRFQSTTLTFSECYKKSGADRAFDCLTCHSPHHDVETSPAFYNSKCLSCHIQGTTSQPTPSPIAICSVSSKGDCISCHMPKIQSVQRHTKFTDHYIRKPAPSSAP